VTPHSPGIAEMPILERDWTPHGWPGHIERFDPAETLFYGSSVAEGICPDFHEDDPDQHDVVPRRLLGSHGSDRTWLQCEECRALWRFRPSDAGPPSDCTCGRCRKGRRGSRTSPSRNRDRRHTHA
jgi:hypothetical protein